MSQLHPNPLVSDLFRLSVEQYHAMIDAGALTTDDKVELLEGILVRRMSKGPKHVLAAHKLADALRARLMPGFFEARQDPITLDESEPEPDLSIIRGVLEDYAESHPKAKDAVFVAEIAESSLRLDQSIKLRTYARAGIAVYWIVNLIDRVVEVYTDPDPKAEPEPTYRTSRTFQPGDAVPVVIAGQTVGSINVNDILP